jgi:archaetidylserine synthase
MKPRFVGRVGPADVVSAANAAVGFLAVVAASVDVDLAARLVLLAAVADGLDGVVARRYGGTEAGQYLDSLADVASFAVAPAAVVAAVALETWSLQAGDPAALAALAVGAAFVATATLRLALYTALDTDGPTTEGIPSTLAATLVGSAVLTGMAPPAALVGALALLSYWMVAPVTYPDLLARDALIMGVVHSLAVLVPFALDRTFPWALLFLALAYLLLAPRLYWRDTAAAASGPGSAPAAMADGDPGGDRAAANADGDEDTR